MISMLWVLGGLVLLVIGGDLLLKASVSLSLRLQIPKIVIGMTVVSFATSLPELMVSLKAAWAGTPDMAMGNVVGSNVANMGLVLGLSLLFGTIEVSDSFYKLDWPVMMIASLLMFGLIVNDQFLGRGDGMILFGCMLLFLFWILKSQKSAAVVDEMPEDDLLLSAPKTLGLLFVGGLALWLGSEGLVKGAIQLASSIGVSDRVIGITVVAVGTSIPELAASVVAMIRKEKAISLGNLLGSNIFNLLSVLGITAMIHPIAIEDAQFIHSDMVYMLGMAFLVFPLVFVPKRMKLSWVEGLILLSIYAVFVGRTIL